MVFEKMTATCPDFKWFGFWISDPIQNLYHLQPYLFLTILKSRLVRISDPHCTSPKKGANQNDNMNTKLTEKDIENISIKKI